MSWRSIVRAVRCTIFSEMGASDRTFRPGVSLMNLTVSRRRARGKISATGFATYPRQESGDKLRIRPESFADHYSQARMFFRSMSEPERRHIISAFAFELGKLETIAIRKRMLGHLMLIDETLGNSVEQALGMEGEAEQITPAREPFDLEESPGLSLIKKARPTLKGRKIGVLVTDGVTMPMLDMLRKAVEKEGAALAVVAPKAGGVKTKQEKLVAGGSRAIGRSLDIL